MTHGWRSALRWLVPGGLVGMMMAAAAALPAAGAGAAPPPAAEPALASGGILIQADRQVVYGASLYDSLRRFLYEAARSGAFGTVESSDRYEWTSAAGREWRTFHVRYEFIDDLDRCSAIPTLAFDPLGHPNLDQSRQILNDVDFRDDLASGWCLVAVEIERPAARYVLRPDGALIDGRSGAAVTRLAVPGRSDAVLEKALWNAFGLERVVGTRFDHGGPADRPDDVDDAVLARTLTHGSAILKHAAARTIAGRLQVSRRRSSGPGMVGLAPRVHEVKPTATELGGILVDSGLLRSADRVHRGAALEAAAAIPSARERLMPAVLAAMTEIVVPEPLTEYQLLLVGRLNTAVPGSGGGLFEDKTPRPGRAFDYLVDAAALAAARFGPADAEQFLTRHEAEVMRLVSKSSSTQGVALAAAAAPGGLRIVEAGIKAFDATPMPIRLWTVAAILAARPGPPSAETMTIVRARCDASGKDAERRFSPLFCDAMAARTGDQAALERLAQHVLDARPGGAGGTAAPTGEAAYALLLDAGPAGVDRLRSVAATADAAAATRALVALCNLGPDAGRPAVERAAALTAAAPDTGTRWALAMCAAPGRSPAGLFVDGRP